MKTSTGLHGKPTTVEMIRIIKDAIGDSALIKAAGGIRDVDTMLAMIDAGASRLGLGVRSAEPIFREIDKRLGLSLIHIYHAIDDRQGSGFP